ncbi:MAG: formylglycine-generating enzyme family protein [Planctomycetota bacterium]
MVGLSKLDQPQTELNSKYRGYLAKQKEAYQKGGKLEAMLEVEAEIENFEGEDSKLATHAELKRLQEIYRQQRADLTTERADKKIKMIESAEQAAKKLAETWTRENRIEDAKLALEESKRFASLADDPQLLKSLSKPPAKPTAASFAGVDPGEQMENEVGLKLCWIPAGRFSMGSPDDELGRVPDRENQVRVEFTMGFWIGKYEVTQEEYQAVMDFNPSGFKGVGKRGPVENVAWDDAMAFCSRLTMREQESGSLPKGWAYSLPTEAQWEYAGRAGSREPVSGGKLDEVAWFVENSGNTTHEVGQKVPNPWGLHDMIGNVREWCLNWYEDEAEGGTDPQGPEEGTMKPSRGGCYRNDAGPCRLASRSRSPKTGTSENLGFRVVIIETDS